VGYCFTRKITTVSPRKWKNEVLDSGHDKAGAISIVERIYPNVNLTPKGKRVPHDGMADAMCIAHYLKITEPPY
jgi:crossover junction endodeoxyribonuclease RuvC